MPISLHEPCEERRSTSHISLEMCLTRCGSTDCLFRTLPLRRHNFESRNIIRRTAARLAQLAESKSYVWSPRKILLAAHSRSDVLLKLFWLTLTWQKLTYAMGDQYRPCVIMVDSMRWGGRLKNMHAMRKVRKVRSGLIVTSATSWQSYVPYHHTSHALARAKAALSL